MKTSIYIGEQLRKIDLFDDENIFFIQKLNDIEKLSNIFSDSTLSFTIPATDNNNSILRHYYDIYINNGYNANLRIPAYIEIDSFPYKFGEIQIEDVKLNNFLSKDYKITFYSKITQLTELFSNDTIDLLDFDDFKWTYNNTNFERTLNDTTYFDGDIITPLISYSDRDWNYGSFSGTASDISSDLTPIVNTELKSALRIIRIIEAIEDKYNISFSRDFFGTELFEKLYIWMNSKSSKPSGQVILNIQNNITTSGPSPNNFFTCSVDTTNNIFTITDNAFDYDPTRIFNLRVLAVGLRDPISNVILDDIFFTLTVIDNDTDEIYLTQTRKTFGGNLSVLQFIFDIPQQSVSTTRNLKFFLSSSSNFTFGVFSILFDYVIGPGNIQRASTENNSGNYLNVYNPSFQLPSIKVIDFIIGIMKMFKLIIRPTSINNFYIDTIDNFYSQGRIIDITKYTNQEEVIIERPDIYSSIKFKYEKTENVLGKRFRQTNDPINDEIGYGDLSSQYIIDTKNELEVKLPFENMLFERLTIESNDNNILTNICIGQSCKLQEDNITLIPNDSKPIIFFNNGLIDITDTPVKIKFGGSVTYSLTSYYLVNNSNNSVFENVTDSINFGSEIDPWFLQQLDKSLYSNYWENWINTIYDKKQRKFKFKSYLPQRYIEELSLNDRIIIGDTRYKINDFKINLQTGETDLNLFVDIYDEYGITQSII